MQHPYDEVRKQLEEDLVATGFEPTTAPPGKEPKFPKNASSLTTEQLRALYDDFLAYYEYLTDQLVEINVSLVPVQAKLTLERNKAVLVVHADKALTNADVREAAVATTKTVVDLTVELTYFKALYDAQEERRKKISKTIERIYREISLRVEQQNAPRVQGGFRPLTR